MRTPQQFFVAGTGIALPGRPVSNGTVADLLGLAGDWIERSVGTRSRHFCWDPATGNLTHSLADLCAEAGSAALDAAGLAGGGLDFLVLSTATPDTLLPTTATVVADRLGLRDLPAYQLQAGSSGPVQALDVAGALLAGGLRAGLVIGGDVTDRFLDVSRPAALLSREELYASALFGDAAGAAAVTARPEGAALTVHTRLHRFMGLGRAPGLIIDWSGAVRTEPGRRMLYEDHDAVREHVPGLAAGLLDDLLAGTGWRRDDIAYVLPPELSGRMTARICDRLGLDRSRQLSGVTEHGNTGNAAALLQLHRLAAESTVGERALALTVEPGKWVVGGLALERTAGAPPAAAP
ncbi:3-oxoacyl-[acyl-carrier-protein] synthase III C-terminal domain-containing protein [Streptomyces sp. NPDC020917]|uniref:3-oxoacyl-[acyl-carrier-protein] synthase III C-terminal domain-containing protein n=1 Tax=Streptomyces sp. NPDC020917 TaxID=3365102 RepID=UPI0037B0F784